MRICENIYYIGVNDYAIRTFEGLFDTPNGMAYNSYLIMDSKIAVMDSVEKEFVQEWLQKIQNCLGDKTPDYLVVLHMEPDHSAGILQFMRRYPLAKIVASRRAFIIVEQLFGESFENRRMIVDDGNSLPLGESALRFFAAPLVHWPEVLVAYENKSKTLFSADAFGSFGIIEKVERSVEEWAEEARRYYFAIVGKFGTQTQNLLAKIRSLDFARICSLHGSVLENNLLRYVALYDKWSKYEVEEKGVCIVYTSVYGNTEKAARYLYGLLEKEKVGEAVLLNLQTTPLSQAIAQAFRFDKLVVATTTYNGGIFPIMQTFLRYLIERNFQKRTIAIVENGSWSPMAGREIEKAFNGEKEIVFCFNKVTLRSALNNESKVQLQALAEELCQ